MKVSKDEYSEYYYHLWNKAYAVNYRIGNLKVDPLPTDHDWKDIPGKNGNHKILKVCTKCSQEISLLKSGSNLKWLPSVSTNNGLFIDGDVVIKCSQAIMARALL